MSSKVLAGDVVTLNDEGLNLAFGTTIGLSYMKTLEMVVTEVSIYSMTFPEEVYDVSVDNIDINRYMLCDTYFDVVERREL